MESLVLRSCLRSRQLYTYNNALHRHSVRHWLARHRPPKPRRRWHTRLKEMEELKNPTVLPIFDKVFNNFVKLAHPDQLQAFGDEYKATNATSWAKLTEILKIINVKSSQRQMIPNTAVYRMDFYIRPSQNRINEIKANLAADALDVDVYNSSVLANEIKKVRLDMRLTGRCPDLMRSQLQNFFKHCGLKQYEFEWGPNYWMSSRDKLKYSQDEKQRKEDSEFVEKEEKVMLDKEKRSTFDKFKFWKKKKK